MPDINKEDTDIFKLAYESAASGIAVADMKGELCKVNPAFLKMWGYEDESEVLNRSASEFHPDPEKANSVATEVVETGEWEGEILAERKDGTTFPVHASASLVTNESGEPVYIMSWFVDITERKEYEQELERTSQFLKDTEEVAEVGGWEVDLQTEKMRWSDELYQIYGLPPEADLTPEEAIEFYHPDDRDTIREAFDHLTTSGEPYDLELRIITTEDDIRWVHTRGKPRYEDDELIAVHGTFQDITERKEQKLQLRSQKEQLDDFASVVSHDIRNPLGVAQGRLEMLKAESESDHIPPIARSLDRIEDIVTDTLTLARQGQAVSDTEPIELINIVGSCWKNISTQSATLDVPDNITIIGDSNRLQHIFENLFRNAIEHGGDDVTVRVGQFSPNGIYVENDGPPIPEEKREEVFEPGHSSASDGTGFGLTIVNRIAEAHGWQVHITEGTDGGARFEFENVEFAAK